MTNNYTKIYYQSRTLIFNAALLIVGIGSYFGLQADPGTISLTKQIIEILGIAAPILNIILRFLTDKGVTVN